MRCFQGFASGLWPACLAIMASTVPRERIGLAMGIMQGGMTAGGVLGPFFGGALAELFSCLLYTSPPSVERDVAAGTKNIFGGCVEESGECLKTTKGRKCRS